MKRQTLAAAVCALGLAGCAPTSNFPTIDNQLAESEARKQRIAAMEVRLRHDERLANVTFRIYAGSSELCGDKVTHRSGASIGFLERYDDEWREVAKNEFKIGERLTVLNVAKNSPAEIAGITLGDKLVGFAGHDLGTGKRANKKLSDLLREHEGGKVSLVVDRQGERRALTLAPVLACDYPVTLSTKDDVNAWADGKAVYITSGMLRFAKAGDELALVIGHELAHNTRNHVASKMGNQLIGALMGAVVTVLTGVDATNLGANIGGAAFSQEFEAEADYVGVYHAARGGFDMTKAASFWRRMATAHPGAIHLSGSTHPSTAKRFLAIEKAVEEIESKRARKLPLVPDERKADKQAPTPEPGS